MASAGQLRKLRNHVKSLASHNDELTAQLNKAIENAERSNDELEDLKESLKSLGTLPACQDVEVQCHIRGASTRLPFAGEASASSRTTRDAPPEDFRFLPRDKKVNWRQLQRLNIDRIVGNNDTAVISRLMEEVAQADIDSESVFNLTEGNLIKIFQLAQLMLQFANHERRVLEYQYDDFLENRELVLQLLERAGVGSLRDLRDGTDRLGHQFQGLAGRELDDMFGQLRVEERAMSRMVLAGAIEETKQKYEAEAEAEQLLANDADCWSDSSTAQDGL